MNHLEVVAVATAVMPTEIMSGFLDDKHSGKARTTVAIVAVVLQIHLGIRPLSRLHGVKIGVRIET